MMRIKLEVRRDGAPLFEGDYSIKNAEEFGAACADAWRTLQRDLANEEPNVGSLMEHLNNDVLDSLQNAVITVTKI